LNQQAHKLSPNIKNPSRRKGCCTKFGWEREKSLHFSVGSLKLPQKLETEILTQCPTRLLPIQFLSGTVEKIIHSIMSFGDVHRYPQIDFGRLHREDEDAAEVAQNDAEFNKVKQILGNIQRRNDGITDGNVEITLSEQEYLSWVIQEREDLVKRVASEMRDTRQIMQDIAMLVEDQGFFVGARPSKNTTANPPQESHVQFSLSRRFY
jgi:hypothetical protein